MALEHNWQLNTRMLTHDLSQYPCMYECTGACWLCRNHSAATGLCSVAGWRTPGRSGMHEMTRSGGFLVAGSPQLNQQQDGTRTRAMQGRVSPAD